MDMEEMYLNKLNKGEIKKYIREIDNGFDIFVYDITDSTNLRAKEFAKKQMTFVYGEKKSVLKGIFVAEEQTNGRGRLGRSFYSPKETGIYMSLLLSADELSGDIQLITIGMAVAVCKAIKEVCGIELGIKWVNDLYKDGKKVCGILAEAVCDEDTGRIKDIVVGIGINCHTYEFPEDIRNIAASLGTVNKEIDEKAEKLIDRNKLIARIAEKVVEISGTLSEKSTIEEYRALSIMYGKEVSYSCKGIIKKGIVSHINDIGNLVVKLEDNTIDILSSGEVSVKGEWD